MAGGTSLVMCTLLVFCWTEEEAQHGGYAVSRVTHDSVSAPGSELVLKLRKGTGAFCLDFLAAEVGCCGN